jgi:hypothetical protein
MTPKLSDEQRSALEQHAGQPVFVVDPVKHLEYVLIPAEIFERVRALLGTEEFDIRETYAAQEQALGTAGWNDPAMDAYNDYDSHRPPQ